jgi:hypothetical protein
MFFLHRIIHISLKSCSSFFQSDLFQLDTNEIKVLFPVSSFSFIKNFQKTKRKMKFLIQLCFVSFLWPLIFAFEFVDKCNQLGGPIFAEKNGSARIGCKTNDYFGYCTLTRKDPHLTCKIEINFFKIPKMVDCLKEAQIRFTGNAGNNYCEFLIENLQSVGNNL